MSQLVDMLLIGVSQRSNSIMLDAIGKLQGPRIYESIPARGGQPTKVVIGDRRQKSEEISQKKGD